MGFVAVKCPNCGANLNVEEDRDTFFCSYCGSKVEREKKIVDLKAHLSIDNFVNSGTLMERALVFLEDGDFRPAATYFDRVLDLSPKHSPAYLGLFLCQSRARNEQEILPSGIPEDLSELKRAIQYADVETGERIRTMLASWKKQADNYLRQGDYAPAERLYHALKEVRPDDPSGYVGLFLSRVRCPSLGAYQDSDSDPADPALIQEADRVSGGQYQNAVDGLRRKHRDAIEDTEDQIREIEHKYFRFRRPNESKISRSTGLCGLLIAACFVLFISTIFNVGKGMTFVYVLLGLSIAGTVFGWIKVIWNNKLTDRLFEMNKKQEKLEELKKQFTQFYGDFEKGGSVAVF